MIERQIAVQRPRRLAQGTLGLALGVMLAACGTSSDSKAANAAPIANAGAAQNAKVDFAVTLDGSASADPEGATLAYYWGVSSKPAGSKVTLSAASASAAQPTFTPDVAGEYVFRLMVSDGVNVSAPAFVTITAAVGNYPPEANAGAAQTVGVGATVTLSGSGKDRNTGDALTYAWTLTTRPEGSAAALANANTASATFTPDVVGTYVASLVVSDGQASSDPATVTITAQAGNLAPIADPSLSPTNAIVARVVTLNGSASKDGNNDPLTYAWTLTTKPASSAATLAGATTVSPTFTPDVVGDYVVQLVVNDGKDSSAAANVTVSATVNAAPVANAGPAQNVIPGTLATLDGTGSSDANGDALTYAWTLTTKPDTSAAALADAATAHPSFTPDLAGTYVVSLVVNDGFVDSVPTTVTITTTSFTASYDFFAPYIAGSTTPSLAQGFSATTAPVAVAPIRFYSKSAAALKLYQASGAIPTFAVNYNGEGFKTALTSPLVEGAKVDVSPSTSLTRFISMPYSPVAASVTATATYTYAQSTGNTCNVAQIALVKADGTILKAATVCSATSGKATISATFTDPVNTEVYVLFTRVTETFGGLRLWALSISTP